MNIVWFTWKDRENPLSGGAEVVTDQLATRLACDGHTVTLITAGFPKSTQQIDRNGYVIVRVGSRYTSYLAAWRYFSTHRKDLSPDLVIDECNTMPFFAGWYTRAPTVLFFHMLCRQIWFYEFPQPLSTIGYLTEPIYLRLLKRCPIITVSNSTKQALICQGFKAEGISVISEGIEFQPVSDLGAIAKYPEPTVLSLGSIRAMKRTLDQIKAFEIAKVTIANLKLIVAGDASGSYGGRVLRAIHQSPYSRDIEYCGLVGTAKKIELMQRAHVIVATSVQEGWGLTITEASSQGTPAIAYNVDGLRDSIQDGHSGLVTSENTPRSMADSIVEVIQNPSQYQRLRNNAWNWSKLVNFDRCYADFKRVAQT